MLAGYASVVFISVESGSRLFILFWRVQQRPRSCNRVAHELASLGSVCDPEEEPVLVSILARIRSVIAKDSAFSE